MLSNGSNEHWKQKVLETELGKSNELFILLDFRMLLMGIKSCMICYMFQEEVFGKSMKLLTLNIPKPSIFEK